MNKHKTLGMSYIWAGCFVVFTLFACGAVYGASLQPRYGGILRYCDQDEGELIGFPPKYKTITYSLRQVAPAIETLVRIDEAGKPIPWLATGIEESPEAKTVTLTLRKGVKFHDGTDFNAEAVKWNLEQHMAARSQGAQNFKSIDVIGDYTVRINLRKWDNTTTDNLSSNVGLIISPTAYKTHGEEWCQDHPVGTGPFQFVSWEKGVRMRYKRFDGYWQKGKPYLDGIECSAIRDSLTRELSLKKGEIDIAMRMPSRDLAGLEKDGFSVIRMKIASGTYGLAPDSANLESPFADIRVRRATQYALDTKTLVASIFAGELEPANQYAYKGNWAYNPSVVGYPYDPAKAKKLLAEAGYRNGFKTKLIYRSTPEWDELFTAVQGYLRAVGIDAELVPMQYPGFTAIAYRSGKWQGLIATVVSSKTDTAAVLEERFAGKSSFYVSMLYPPDYVEAIQKAISAPNFELKRKYTQEAMKLMIDKYCLQIPIYCPTDPIVTQPYVHSHGAGASAANALWTPEEAWKER